MAACAPHLSEDSSEAGVKIYRPFGDALSYACARVCVMAGVRSKRMEGKEGEGTANERLMWRCSEEDGGWRGAEMCVWRGGNKDKEVMEGKVRDFYKKGFIGVVKGEVWAIFMSAQGKIWLFPHAVALACITCQWNVWQCIVSHRWLNLVKMFWWKVPYSMHHPVCARSSKNVPLWSWLCNQKALWPGLHLCARQNKSQVSCW